MIAHVINLKHREDRLQYSQELLQREGLQMIVHEATNGQVEYLEMFDSKRMRGHAGCHNSHITLLEKIKGTAKHHLILEDDCELINGFKDKAQGYIDMMPNDFSVLYLGGNIGVFNKAIEPLNKHFSLAKKVMATHAYVVNDSQIDFILSILKRRVYKIDMMFMEVQQAVDVYITNECLAWQRETFSDIGFDVLKVKTKY
jgi:GR25 family glycosyltransferase involved in LPS biosynthesis